MVTQINFHPYIAGSWRATQRVSSALSIEAPKWKKSAIVSTPPQLHFIFGAGDDIAGANKFLSRPGRGNAKNSRQLHCTILIWLRRRRPLHRGSGRKRAAGDAGAWQAPAGWRYPTLATLRAVVADHPPDWLLCCHPLLRTKTGQQVRTHTHSAICSFVHPALCHCWGV